MNELKPIKQLQVLIWTILFLGLIGTGVCSGEEPLGTLEGVGTYFEITDSEYLNVTISSTETINLRLESIPDMITMHIESASSSPSTSITLGGFLHHTTYYKYEDDYHNLEVFTTDGNGNYTYTQDISIPHLVFIQPRPSTKHVKDDSTGGDCTTFGTWDPNTKTCILYQDVNGVIQIDSGGITLDGNGYAILPERPEYHYSGYGVYLPGSGGVNGVTIKNLTVQYFSRGIFFYQSSGNILVNNTLRENTIGIGLYYSSSNILINNTSSHNIFDGINLNQSNNNTIASNTVYMNPSGGIYLGSSNDNTLTGNMVFQNGGGIRTLNSNGNTIAGNIISSNTDYGINMWNSKDNTNKVIITNNIIDSNGCGIELYACENNDINNNNFINNITQAYAGYKSTHNNFDGNYWSDWTTPDNNNDGFVDYPYVIEVGHQDNFPRTIKSGWVWYITGFLPPIKVTPLLNVFKSGRAVPVKFQLTDANGNCVSKMVVNFMYQYDSDTTKDREIVPGVSKSKAATGSLFKYDPDTCQYIFNWDTTGVSPGTYNIYAVFDDGTTPITGQVGVKK